MDDMCVDFKKYKERNKRGAPKGCHHKAVVQCQGQRGDSEQARGVLRAEKII